MDSTNTITIDSRPAFILHVDDNRAAQMIMRRALAGAQVHSASNVADARSLYDRHVFDLVITDFHLGDADGMDVIDMVRSSPRAAVPILAVSNSMDDALCGRLLRIGANMAMMKPIDPGIIRNAVNQLLAKPTLKATPSSVIGVKCFAWIRQGVHYLFSPDCGVTVRGASVEEARSSLLKEIQIQHESLGLVRAEKIIDLAVPQSP